jgi:membrane protease YdiL (CAAX protease family)
LPSDLPPTRRPTAPTRSLLLLRFLAGCAWLIFSEIVASSAAQGIANRLNVPVLEQLIEQAFLLLLLLTGFALPYGFPRDGAVRTGSALLRRATSAEEWQRGAALGWAMLLVAVLPMMLTGVLHPAFWLWPRSWGFALLSLATIALSTLALEVAFRGYLFRRLIELIGPVAATFFLSMAYAVMSSFRPNSTALSVIVTFFAGVLLSMAYLRTYALWFGWGLHFGWNAAMGLALGLPVAGYATYNTLVATNVTGPNWLTGGFYGPEAAVLTLFVMLAAMIVLYRITRNYAWDYTHAPIVAAGYPMTVAPPEAHNAMAEAATAQPASLVQILSTTSANASTVPILDEHLRRDTNSPPQG